MDDKTLSPLTIDLSGQTQLRFSDPSEAINWINHQQQEFRWLQDGGSRAGGGAQNIASVYINGFNTVRQAANNWANNVTQESHRTQLANHIQGFYSNSNVVRPDHEFVRIAKDIAEKDGATAASAAFAFLLGQDCQLNFETFKGLIAARLIRDGIQPKSPDLVASALADLNSAAKSQMKTNAVEWDNFSSSCQAQLKATEEEFKKQTSEFNAATDETFKRVNESVDESLRSIRTTEETYKEQMKLQAPVDYWQTKAEKHAEALTKSRRTLITFATLGSLALVGALLYVTNTAFAVAEKSNTETAVFLKYAAIGAVITTIGFWIARVLLRIYLSDRHLLTDAEERIALIKTYLALSNDSKVEAADRALILAPLFRTAADGIVKEDGPDASVAGIIAKALESKAGR